ncbi:MAG: hypothetical protein IJV16_06525, partial [Lachnospiraceae bacterium]|nr:hypothetical protein [Lachnospiraceae bacterium]
MRDNTNLQRTILAVEGDPKLDRAVKELFADKQVLSRILKRVTKEFKDETVEDIMSAIEGEPEIESVPVVPGLTNVSRVPPEATKIIGDNTESNITNEGIYYFDVKFSVRLPDKEIADFGIRIIVDVEGQYDYYPGYDAVTRGIFYGTRMISSQSGTEFVGEGYSNIRKVYSIWICMDPPDYAENSIVRFSITPEVITGEFPQEKLEKMKYDLMDVVLVFISTERSSEKDELCGMLEVLLDEKAGKEERLSKLEKDYGMKRTYELESKVGGMCDYSVGIAMKNYASGEAQGEA